MENENRLIGEFMGYFPQDIVSIDGYKGWWSKPDALNFPNHNYSQIMFGAMKFDTSWDWLMPVLDEIEKKGAKISLISNFNPFHKSNFYEISIEIVSGELSKSGSSFRCDGYKYQKHSDTGVNKLEVVYNSAVEFIKWFNDRNE